MLMLAASLWVAGQVETERVLVVVPLCDGGQLSCGRGDLGDPRSLSANLYWGALYGADRFLRRQPDIRARAGDVAVDERARGVLARTFATRTAGPGERGVEVELVAFDGARIDEALATFLRAATGDSYDLVVWTGHDRLMDVPAPAIAPDGPTRTPVVVLACDSERYFGPVLQALAVPAVALTRSFMAPEGYLVDAVLDVAARGRATDRAAMRAALIGAYARYQQISTSAAASVFSASP
jgi:hypothetical protein